MFRLHRANSRFVRRRKTETAYKKLHQAGPEAFTSHKLSTMLQARVVVGLDGFRAEVDLRFLEAAEGTNSLQYDA